MGWKYVHCTALKPMNYLLSSMHCTGFLGVHTGGGGEEGCETPLPISPRWGDCESHLFTGQSLLGTPQLPPGLRVGHISPALRADQRVHHNLRYWITKVALIKKEKKIFLISKEIQRDRVQSHIWLTGASSYMVKYLRISSYMKKPFPIYDFAPDPIWISSYMMKI
jgi:hypothetical protein